MFLKKAYAGKNDLWRYLIALALVIPFAYGFLGSIPFSLVATSHVIKNSSSSQDVFSYLPEVQTAIQNAIQTGDYSLIGMTSNTFLLYALFPFVLTLLALWFVTKVMHKKKMLDITTARPKLDWSRIGFGFGVWAAMLAVAEVVSYFLDPGNYVWQFEIKSFLILAAIALTLLPIQTSTEELVMRGYLMQGISLISKHRWIPLVVTSLIFGLLHGSNPEVAKYGFWVVMPGYIGIGLALAIMTLMDDGLELALGVHAANNIFGALFVTFEGSVLSTPALFKVLEINPALGTVFTLVFSAIFLLIASKKYNWVDWSKAFGDVKRPEWGMVEAEDRDVTDHLVNRS
ncbi:MAG: lysostaphin resistance A-like protein [Bacteroidota bacterium]